MNEPALIAIQRRLLSQVVEESRVRSHLERQLQEELTQRRLQAEQALHERLERIETEAAQARVTVEKETAERREEINKRFQAEYGAADSEYRETMQAIAEEFETARERIEQEYKEAQWSINTLYEASRTAAENQYLEVERQFESSLQRITAMQQEGKSLLKQWRQQGAYARIHLVRHPMPPDDEVMTHLEGLVAEAEETLARLRGLFLPRFFKGINLVWIFLFTALALAAPAWFLTQGDPVWTATVLLCATVLGGSGLAALLYLVARSQVYELYQALRQTLFDAEQCRERYLEMARSRREAQLLAVKHKRNTELRQASDKAKEAREQITRRRIKDTAAAEARFPPLLAELKRRHAEDLAALDQNRQERLAAIEQQRRADTQAAQEAYDHALEEAQRDWETRWQAMAQRWHRSTEEIRRAIDWVRQEAARLFPAWAEPTWNAWRPPDQVPQVFQLGRYQVDLRRITGALPDDEALRHELPESFDLPALVAFPHRASLLLRTQEDGRKTAIRAMQAWMLRLLTVLPPGKVRFTIIDPVGLGENFASFMHLADHDEQLITGRIWTEPHHIEQRLADITAQMETIIQKYLRNQYRDIAEYNAQAGEVAEPFRFVVVADFPVNFTVEAARRLVSIASSGVRCGVHTLVLVDERQPMPVGFELSELEQAGVQLVWKDGRFVWRDADFERFPLRFEEPADDALTTRLLHRVGEQAKQAKRVEVPFDFVAPPPEQYWTSDSTMGLSVPLGRAGATKRQRLELGRGTAQHVLVAGKTGSGKSTLMHALITNLALLYSPEEVELYLVDFKKGVEFKDYATWELPHARVIAIESEREFGLSVLQRLDFELKRRADRFREVGAQDLAACRKADPSKPLPRILLIVDEFQEFFVEDDRIAQDAALLLDRLVRQGRAFGIHVLLGSQTLGGAYTLARSTIDQMAVRIALQCSEVDAHLILSEDNSAARLLSRPGEAIYNDANGLVEGNSPFQIVWISDEQREHYLRQIQELDRLRGGGFRDQIVFEGNAPANVATNSILHKLLSAPNWPKGSRAFQAWLGDAIAIKDPTAAVFRPQSGSNLMIVGQDDEAALGILTTAILSLASQHPPFLEEEPGRTSEGEKGTPPARFLVLDGTLPDSTHAGLFPRLAHLLPHSLQSATWRQSGPLVAEAAAEVARRLAEPDREYPAWYVIVYALQRFRDLRRDEDDFSFGRSGDTAANTAEQFATILREGPALGVHVLLWCDTLNNLTRTLSRQNLREFEMRVLFQMSPGDSSNLIDTPLASKLGLHRALYYSEEQGRAEKFRPYAVPDDVWLHWAGTRLRSRTEAFRHPPSRK
ncbi:MAG: FtsK/SpoIIIE domain-containing protein [Gemmatales bacterium]|nr:FtsK/SpoIIIE domain-containing protein [Gemmatales bacterium]MDW8386749.1 FtsK/SpoIIIE domain-containing protein [Gemmatales bacterium]